MKSKKTPTEFGAKHQWLIAGIGLFVITSAFVWFMQFRNVPQNVAVTMPEMSSKAVAGQLAFEANCAACHGSQADGSNSGPPLIHKIYEPSHHGDMSFRLAVQQGVRQHHWKFGNMPARPEVSAREVEAIITFVREVQQANGIF